MNKLTKSYWDLFNKFARFIGWSFLLGGIYGAGSTAYELYKFVNNKASWVTDSNTATIGIIMFLVVAIGGLLMIRAKPYYPKV